jgi:hypothetical protein
VENGAAHVLGGVPAGSSDEETADRETPTETLEQIRAKVGRINLLTSRWPRLGFLLGFAAAVLAGCSLACSVGDGQSALGRRPDLVLGWGAGILVLGCLAGLLAFHAAARLESELKGKGSPSRGVGRALALYALDRPEPPPGSGTGECAGGRPPGEGTKWAGAGCCVGGIGGLVLGTAASLTIVFTAPTLLGPELRHVVVRAIELPPLTAVCLSLLLGGAGRLLDAWRRPPVHYPSAPRVGSG